MVTGCVSCLELTLANSCQLVSGWSLFNTVTMNKWTNFHVVSITVDLLGEASATDSWGVAVPSDGVDPWLLLCAFFAWHWPLCPQPPMGEEGGRRRHHSSSAGDEGRRRRHPSNTTSKPTQATKSSGTTHQPAPAVVPTASAAQNAPKDNSQKTAAGGHVKKAGGKKESAAPNKWKPSTGCGVWMEEMQSEEAAAALSSAFAFFCGKLFGYKERRSLVDVIGLVLSVHFTLKQSKASIGTELEPVRLTAPNVYKGKKNAFPAFGLKSSQMTCQHVCWCS